MARSRHGRVEGPFRTAGVPCAVRNQRTTVASDAVGARWPRNSPLLAGFTVRRLPGSAARSCRVGQASRLGATPASTCARLPFGRRSVPLSQCLLAAAGPTGGKRALSPRWTVVLGRAGSWPGTRVGGGWRWTTDGRWQEGGSGTFRLTPRHPALPPCARPGNSRNWWESPAQWACRRIIPRFVRQSSLECASGKSTDRPEVSCPCR